MSKKTGQAMRELRDIIDVTQGEFAIIIGASKDAVASWEVGRNELSRSFARRIALATGVEAEDLLRGRKPLMTYVPMAGRRPFTAETFEQHRKSYWGATDEGAARRHLKNGADALGLIFLAAAGARNEKGTGSLPAVVDSFIQWCEQTREDFGLEAAIDRQLDERKGEVTINQTYGQWRQKQREEPSVGRAFGFKDDPKKDDRDYLQLTGEFMPVWRPGHSMGAGRGKG